MNVIQGRYKMVTNQFKDLLYGLYGQLLSPGRSLFYYSPLLLLMSPSLK